MTSKLGGESVAFFEENGLKDECSAVRLFRQESRGFRTIVSDVANRL